MSLALIAAFIEILILVLLYFTTYRRFKVCPPDKIMMVQTMNYGQKMTKCIHGGTRFVLPMAQSYDFLDMKPISLDLNIEGISFKDGESADLTVKIIFSISTKPHLMNQAAQKLQSKSREKVTDLARNIIIISFEEIIPAFGYEEIETCMDRFHEILGNSIESNLNEIGCSVYNFAILNVKKH